MARQKNDGRGRLGGRAKGTKNRISRRVKEIISETLAAVDSKTLIEKLFDIDNPKDFIQCYCKLAEYIEQKNQPYETGQQEENKLRVQIVYTSLEQLELQRQSSEAVLEA